MLKSNITKYWLFRQRKALIFQKIKFQSTFKNNINNTFIDNNSNNDDTAYGIILLADPYSCFACLSWYELYCMMLILIENNKTISQNNPLKQFLKNLYWCIVKYTSIWLYFFLYVYFILIGFVKNNKSAYINANSAMFWMLIRNVSWQCWCWC